MKKFKYVILLICTLTMVACQKRNTPTKDVFDIKLKSNNIYSIKCSSQNRYLIKFKYKDTELSSKELKNTLDVNLFDILKKYKNKNEIALVLAEKGEIPIEFIIDNGVSMDTTIIFRPKIEFKQIESYAKVTSGICAKLEEKSLGNDYILAIREYLYDNNHQISDSLLNIMANIVKELDRTEYDTYTTSETIPILSSYPASSYTIKTNMKADYYYLLMSNDENIINEFIKDRIVNKFDGGETNISKPLNFYRNENIGGIQILFLIGLNKDWEKQIIPVGMIAVNNMFPSIRVNTNHIYSDVVLSSYRQKIIIPTSPILDGWVSLVEQNSGGNGISCTVSFKLSFGGDVKSVTLVREKHLTYPYPPDGFGYRFGVKPERKVIDLTDKTSPYYFKYELHLDDGDNYLPVIITDMRGNQTEFKLNIPASFTRHTPSTEINIDNDIDIYN